MTTIIMAQDQKTRNSAAAFMREVAFRWHRSSPRLLPKHVFVAYQSRKIVGTAGLDFAKKGALLPIESHWSFPKPHFWGEDARDDIAEFGRWMTTAPGISVQLLHAITIFAQSHRKKYLLLETKPRIAERLKQLGCILDRMEGATLDISSIPHDQRPYYLAEPPPQLYIMKLEQMYGALIEKISPLNQTHFSFTTV